MRTKTMYVAMIISFIVLEIIMIVLSMIVFGPTTGMYGEPIEGMSVGTRLVLGIIFGGMSWIGLWFLLAVSIFSTEIHTAIRKYLRS